MLQRCYASPLLIRADFIYCNDLVQQSLRIRGAGAAGAPVSTCVWNPKVCLNYETVVSLRKGDRLCCTLSIKVPPVQSSFRKGPRSIHAAVNLDQHVVANNKQPLAWNCIFCICESVEWNPGSSVRRSPMCSRCVQRSVCSTWLISKQKISFHKFRYNFGIKYYIKTKLLNY